MKGKCKEEAEENGLDKNICKQMGSLVELLTTSGKPILNPEIMKKFKKLCRTSDDYVEHAFNLLMKQLSKNHAEIRLSTFQMINEIFNRSHAFRLQLLTDFQRFLELAVGVKKCALPPPKAAANTLKSEACRSIQAWYDKFGEAYKQLTLAYNFLKSCEKVDFTRIIAEQETERRRKEEMERKLAEKKHNKLEKALKEFEESREEIQLCVTEIENGLQLLMPHPDDFFIPTSVEAATTSNPCLFSNCERDLLNVKCSSSQGKVDFSGAGVTEQTLDPTSIRISGSTVDVSINNELQTDCERKKSNNVQNCEEKGDVEKTNSNIDEIASENLSHRDESDEDSMEEVEEYEEVNTGELRNQEYGMFSRQFGITISVGEPSQRFEETEDNLAVVQTVRDQYRLIKSNYLPHIKHCLQVLDKCAASSQQLEEVVKMREKLEDVLKKCLELEVVSDNTHPSQDSDSDDDFEDVPEKEGYEEEVPEHIKLQAACSSSSKTKPGRKKRTSKKKSVTISKGSSKSSSWKQTSLQQSELSSLKHKIEGLQKKNTSCSASDGEPGHGKVALKQEVADPDNSNQFSIKIEPGTSLVQIKQEPGEEQGSSLTGTGGSKSLEERKQDLLQQAPVISFGLDLKHWENMDQLTAPERVSYADASRFWVPSKDGAEDAEGNQEEVAALMRRTIPYVGQFEPVKWKCRAPLGDGRLCERMDRVKCPFHGKVIGRDSTGTPTNPADLIWLANQDMMESEDSESDDAEHPAEGSSDIERSKGKGRGKGKGKGKGKSKKRKYPNLTDTREVETSRDRLEAKIFKRSALKKVCATMDAIDHKRVSDRFANQFNYSLK